MDLANNIQEGVLALLCFDNESAPILDALVPIEAYDPYYKQVASAATEFRAKHGAVPGEHTFDVIHALGVKDEASADAYDMVFQSMEDLKGSVQPSYIIEQARNFARWSQLRKAWLKQGTGLDRRDMEGLEAAEAAVRESIEPMADLFDPGADMSDIDRLSEIFTKDDYEIIPTGIPAIDSHRCGPARGRLHCLMASSGRGKSMYLAHITRQAAKRGHKVAYLSFEMDEGEVMQRLYQGAFGIAEAGKVESVLKIRATKDGQYDGMTRVVFEDGPRPTLQDGSARSRMENNVDKARGWLSNIRVKSFPQNTMTTDRLKGYLDSTAMHSGFVPDLLVLDYADLFKKRADDIRGSLRLIYEDLKGLSQERNMAVATVTQSNRSGVNSKVITEDQIGEDFSKVQTADSLITLMATDEEHSVGFARLFVAKNRGGRGRFQIGITQNYALSQFCLSSCEWDDMMEGDMLSQPMQGHGDRTRDALVETIL
tara:strand:+ start:28754 stop:30205 length:1452 start_codon:yes stop_codon:yes gene_type:complete